MSERFFASDLHFGHKFMAELRGENGVFPEHKELAVLLETSREAAASHMDEMMVRRWNEAVRPNDEVFFLGDLSFAKREETQAIFDTLHGRKHLFRGNHDAPWVDQLGWVSVKDFGRVRGGGESLYCFHYPMLTWPNAHKGTYHLHGHTHGNLHAPQSTRMDVGPDCTGKIVISADECLEILSKRTFDAVDHHQ